MNIKYIFYETRRKILRFLSIKLKYIDKDGSPMKCKCGCKDFYITNMYYEEVWGSIVECEYTVKCKKCDKTVGHYAYVWTMGGEK